MSGRQADADRSGGPSCWPELHAADRFPAVSPSGYVAYTVVEPTGESSVLIVDPADEVCRRIPHAAAGVPTAWSHDGSRLASTDGESTIVIWDAATDQLATLSTPGTGRIVDLFWSGDLAVVAIVAPRSADSSVSEGALRPLGADAPVVRSTRPDPRHLVEVPVDGGPPRAVDADGLSIWEACAIGRREYAVIASDDATENGWYGARVLAIGTGRPRELYRPTDQIGALCVDTRHTRLGFIEGWASDRGHVAGAPRALDIATGELTAWEIEGADLAWLGWRDPDTLEFWGWSGTTTASGSCAVGRPADLHVDEEVTRDRRVVAGVTAAIRHEPGLRPVTVVRRGTACAPSHAPRPATPRTPVDDVEWLAQDGTRIEGLLIGGGRDRALVVMIHGGPANLWTRALPVGAVALEQAGYAVLLPNPRGSVGRGRDFARANLGDPGGAELDDVVTGATACRERGLVADRAIGVVGGSYGGYLAACAANDRADIAAAVVMYGHPDLLSARFASNNAAFYDLLLGGRPDQELIGRYIERSPALWVHAGTAPTLVLHGALDACTPLGQGEELFMALRERHVPTELVVYPNDGHGLRSADAQRDVWRRTRAWFDRHLGAVER